MTRKHLLLTVATLAFASAALVAYLSTNREQPTVTITTVVPGTVDSTITNTRAGTVKACRRAHLSPSGSGHIARIPIHKGMMVKQDQILMELWNDDVTSQVKLATNEVATTQAQRKQACLLADNAETESTRQQTLSTSGLTSREAADRALTNARSLRAQCRATESQYQVSRARLDVAQAQLERTLLRAPFAGTVADIHGEVGEFVAPTPSSTPTAAVDLIDDSCLYISAPIDEVDSPQIRPGMDARISLDAFPGQTFPAIVQQISSYVSEAESQARTVEVELVFADPADFRSLRPGYSADAEVILDSHHNVLRIPTEALLEGNKVLMYRDRDGLLSERLLTIGLTNWRYTEVLSGLKAGEKIVTSVGREGIKAGIRARAENPAIP
ncbi:MAG: efflux RND transporter periplasmic adaptor subunit [Gammaproteobacteria bacterium]|nr:efflux RND transporter periplasmic adaptor subunit [Gammaproteobacteria bacterium]